MADANETKAAQAKKTLAVFSIRETGKGSIWVRAGRAFMNKDGSLNVYLDVLPIDGKLHVREQAETAAPKQEEGPVAETPAEAVAA